MTKSYLPTIIYIGGVEHCGSTLMGLILDQSPQITCVGELSHLPRAGWTDGSESECSCGKRISECTFWCSVRKRWEEESGSSVKQLFNHVQTFDRNIALPKLLMNKIWPSRKFKAYLKLNQTLFESIKSVSGDNFIADTSKRVSRAMALSMMEGVNFRLIHLIRDSRGITYSSAKKKREIRRGWLESVVRWNLINRSLTGLRKFIGPDRMTCVKYEDLLKDPEGTITSLGEFIGVDLTDVAMQVANRGILHPGHLAVGNSFIRSSKEIRLNPHDDWREKMPEPLQERVWRFTKLTMEYFDYAK